MTQVEAIQAEIESLSGEEFVRLRQWIIERDWQDWDRQIEQDSSRGCLEKFKISPKRTLIFSNKTLAIPPYSSSKSVVSGRSERDG